MQQKYNKRLNALFESLLNVYDFSCGNINTKTKTIAR